MFKEEWDRMEITGIERSVSSIKENNESVESRDFAVWVLKAGEGAGLLLFVLSWMSPAYL
jgi:hypothetical protein